MTCLPCKPVTNRLGVGGESASMSYVGPGRQGAGSGLRWYAVGRDKPDVARAEFLELRLNRLAVADHQNHPRLRVDDFRHRAGNLVRLGGLESIEESFEEVGRKAKQGHLIVD